MTVRYYARAALLQVRARRAAEEMIDLQPKKDADVWWFMTTQIYLFGVT